MWDMRFLSLNLRNVKFSRHNLTDGKIGNIGFENNFMVCGLFVHTCDL